MYLDIRVQVLKSGRILLDAAWHMPRFELALLADVKGVPGHEH